MNIENHVAEELIRLNREIERLRAALNAERERCAEIVEKRANAFGGDAKRELEAIAYNIRHQSLTRR